MGIWSFSAILTRSASEAASIFCMILLSMNLEGDLADFEFCRRLLIEQPADHQRQHFAFTGRKLARCSSQLFELRALLSNRPILLKRPIGLHRPDPAP